MKLIHKIFALTTLTVASSAAFAQTAPAPINLTVTGKIVPVSCNVTIDANGVFNYPDISAGILNQSAPYQMGALDKNFTINCPSAAAKVGFSVIDNQNTSAAWATLDVPGVTGAKAFGLGIAGGKNIGAYALTMDTFAVEGENGQLLSTNDPASGIWAVNTGVTGLENTVATTYNLAKATDTDAIPHPYQNYSGILHVQASINSKDELAGALDDNVALNGSATINLVYL
jgi:type 1 fimbria pilin